ncbi:MAG: Ig-like domain-containing protein [Anaerolineales bacterium]|nr:Ig-like domain-containing protein [Anaerolineales bacterium]
MQKTRTAELTQKRENQSLIRLFLAFCLAALAVLAWSASAFAVAAPPDPAPDAAAFGAMDALCTSEGLLQWLDPVDGTITIYMLPQGDLNPRGVRTPVAEITMTDGRIVHGYCLNALQNGPSDRPYCLDAPVDDVHLAYLISKYPPTLASGVQQAARQAAVWHYTNGWTLNADSTTSLDPVVDAAVTAAYTAILADVDSLDVNNLPAELLPGDPVLEITPVDATNWLPASAAHPFTVTLTKGGKPLTGYTVNVASDFGALDQVSATTDGNGQAAFTVTSNVAGTANLTATASFEIRTSMRFLTN